MEKTLQLKDFMDFDEVFTKMKLDIYEKNARGKPLNEDLLSIFQKLYTTID
jgi:hypothetical protein